MYVCECMCVFVCVGAFGTRININTNVPDIYFCDQTLAEYFLLDIYLQFLNPIQSVAYGLAVNSVCC